MSRTDSRVAFREDHHSSSAYVRTYVQRTNERTHHNALRLSSMSHQTVGLAQARLNNTRGGIVILIQLKKGNAAIGGQIQVPNVYSCSHW